MRRFLPLLLLLGCNPAPTDVPQSVGYRSTIDDQADNGERGNVVISEVLWSGSVTNEGSWDRDDLFIELRNEGARPVNLSGWWLIIEGVRMDGHRLPATDRELDVGAHAIIAKKSDGCFPEADFLLPELDLPYGDPFRITLRDVDERLIEPAGSRTMPPFAGGYDGVYSRSMERVQLMFGGRGTEPHMWHFYTPDDEFEPNNLRIAENCRERTHASPGAANSPDYSGAYAAGAFE